MTAAVVVGAGLEEMATAVGAVGPVAAVGGRTAWDLGGAPRGDDVRLVAAPVGLVEHVPAEMTVRVGAGTTVADLHAALSEAGQTTVLPERSGSTVGGALAVGRDGVGRLGRGRLRDALLEARYVSAEGRVVKAGGPTVKNVSGYDLCRLLVGSLGTLGLLGEVVLRTRPVPPCSRWFAGEGADLAAVRGVLYRPAAVLWDGSMTSVWLEGHEADVEAEATVLAGLGLAAVDGPPAVPPHRRACAVEDLASLAGPFLAELGTGVAHVDEPAPAPVPPEPVVALARRIREALDPTGRLNPGRDPLAVVR